MPDGGKANSFAAKENFLYKTNQGPHRAYEKFSRGAEYLQIPLEYFEIPGPSRAKLGPSQNPSVYRGFRGVGVLVVWGLNFQNKEKGVFLCRFT